MTTPEGRVKAVIRDLLDGYEGLWQYWPVPSGYGRKTVDVLASFRGRFFVIEAKREGEAPTLLQQGELEAVAAAGGDAFVIAGENDIELVRLKAYLDLLKTMVADDPYITPTQVRRPTL